VLGLIAEGRSNSGIADELAVTVSAVERHVTSIFGKLGLHKSPDAHRRILAMLKYPHA
jgi:DNA-binding NarL/FixJ family response regulator